jgi:hypothetical protein
MYLCTITHLSYLPTHNLGNCNSVYLVSTITITVPIVLRKVIFLIPFYKYFSILIVSVAYVFNTVTCFGYGMLVFLLHNILLC